MIKVDEIDAFEGTFRLLIQRAGFQKVITGLHNACCHGEVFKKISDKQLAKLFDHFDGKDGLLKLSQQVK